jgi:hypothetical protein
MKNRISMLVMAASLALVVMSVMAPKAEAQATATYTNRYYVPSGGSWILGGTTSVTVSLDWYGRNPIDRNFYSDPYQAADWIYQDVNDYGWNMGYSSAALGGACQDGPGGRFVPCLCLN